MKKYFSRLLLSLFLIAAVFSFYNTADLTEGSSMPYVITAAAAKKKIRLKAKKATVTTGASYTLKLLNEKGKTIKSTNVKWSSSSKKIATVSKNGVIKSKKQGTATITASYKNKKYTFKLTVKDASISKKEKALTAGEAFTLTLKDGKGKKVSASKVSWASSNSDAASVDKKGKVTALSKGSAKITATYLGKKYTCKVTVKTASISEKEKTLSVGNSFTLTLKNYEGKEIAAKDISWTSSDSAVASVSGGEVKAHADGTVTITATYKGIGYTCKVICKMPSLSKTKLKLAVNDTYNLDLTDGEGNSLEGFRQTVWSSSDKEVADVNSYGEIRAFSEGSCNITAVTFIDGKRTEFVCELQVVFTGPESTSLTVYREETIYPVFYDENGKVTYDVEYDSENWNIASITESYNDQDEIHGEKAGETRVTATYKDKTYIIDVTVKEIEIHLNYEKATLYPGDTLQLEADTVPSGMRYEWYSSDEKVAKVTRDGLVTVVGNGRCEIGAKYTGLFPYVTGTCDVNCVVEGTTMNDALESDNDNIIVYKGPYDKTYHKFNIKIRNVYEGGAANEFVDRDVFSNEPLPNNNDWCVIVADITYYGGTDGSTGTYKADKIFNSKYIYDNFGYYSFEGIDEAQMKNAPKNVVLEYGETKTVTLALEHYRYPKYLIIPDVHDYFNYKVWIKMPEGKYTLDEYPF